MPIKRLWGALTDYTVVLRVWVLEPTSPSRLSMSVPHALVKWSVWYVAGYMGYLLFRYACYFSSIDTYNVLRPKSMANCQQKMRPRVSINPQSTKCTLVQQIAARGARVASVREIGQTLTSRRRMGFLFQGKRLLPHHFHIYRAWKNPMFSLIKEKSTQYDTP